MTQVFQTVHPHSDLNDLWERRLNVPDLEAMRTALTKRYGAFPILFSIPPRENPAWSGEGVGLVITGLTNIPGAADRDDLPFLGACLFGYVPALGHDGLHTHYLNKVVTHAFDLHTKPAPTVDPMKGSRPDLIGKSEEMPEGGQQQMQRPGR